MVATAWRAMPLIDRISVRLAVRGPRDCWLWDGETIRKGYGRVRANGRKQLVHRVVYELLVGPIPDGLTLDHLCRHRLCCNPCHLEPVTNRENTMRGETIAAANARKTHCKHGHEFTPANTEARSENPAWRRCRTCRRGRRR